MITLYYMQGACSLAAHIVLEWADAEFSLHEVKRDALKSPEYLKINPLGAVPAMDVDGHILTQNDGVLTYLAETFPKAGLEGDGTAMARAEVNRWFGMINSDLHQAYKPIFGATAYLGDDAMIEKSKENAKKRVRQIFEIINEHMEGKEWIAEARSIADPYLYVMIRWAHGVGIDISDLANVENFAARMDADPAVKRALKAEGSE